MKKLLTFTAAAAFFILSANSAFAGKCEIDATSPVGIDDAQLNFNPLVTSQLVTVSNNGFEPLTVSSFVKSNWFDSSGCEGVTLEGGEACDIIVNFYPGNGGTNRQYHKRLTVSGITDSGNEFDQAICLDATN